MWKSHRLSTKQLLSGRLLLINYEGKAILITFFLLGNHVETIDNPMHEASKSGQIDFLKECIANQISINGRGENSESVHCYF